jgi:hypothetical protein
VIKIASTKQHQHLQQEARRARTRTRTRTQTRTRTEHEHNAIRLKSIRHPTAAAVDRVISKLDDFDRLKQPMTNTTTAMIETASRPAQLREPST